MFILALVFAQFAQAQTVDDIINKYIAAMGGKEKMMSLTTVKFTGNLNIQGADVSIITTKKHLVGSRADISVMGSENYQIVTPAKGWVFMPVQGQTSPEEMPEDQFNFSVNLLDLQGTLINYKEKGTTIEMAAKETVDGTGCYKLKVIFKNGNHTDYYIDSKSNFIFRISTKGNMNGEETDIATTYSNYKQNADGYWFAYTSSNSRGETNYEKIETNIPVDDSIFKQ